MRDLAWNVMARDKALYDGHAVAAVAAISPAIAEDALDLIEVTYEILPHVLDVEAAMDPDAPVLHDHIVHLRSAGKADDAVEHRRPASVRARRRRRGAGRRRGVGRGALHHQGRAPGLHRAARLRGLDDRRRPGPGLELQPGPLHGPHLLRQGAAARHLQPARDARRDRRRLRRQDHGLPRAGRAVAVAPGRRAGEDGDEPRRGVPRHRPDQRRRDRGQARRHQGRNHHRRRRRAEVPGRRLPGLAGRARPA